MNDQKLRDVKPGFVFRFYKFGTQKLLRSMNLRLGAGCGYAELGEAFGSVEKLDSAKVDASNEMVVVLGPFRKVFKAQRQRFK